jgi:hypothetical protein
MNRPAVTVLLHRKLMATFTATVMAYTNNYLLVPTLINDPKIELRNI